MTKKIQLFSFITFSFIGLLIILVKLLLLDKGLVMDDEAWFLLLMRDLPTGGDAPTQFYKLFNNIFNGNIFSIRLSFLFFEVICYSVFSLGVFTYFKNQLNFKPLHFFIILSVTVIGNAIFSLPICNIPYYANLNKTLLPFSIGIFLLGINQFKNNKKHLWVIFFSGVIIGFQPFIMITTITVYPLFYFLIYYYFRKKNVKVFLIYNLGILTSIGFYFTIIESPFHFINEEIMPNMTAYSSSDYNEKHGILPIIRWIFVTLEYIFFDCLLLALGFIAFIYIQPKLNNIQKKLAYGIIILASCVFYYFDVIKGEHEYSSMNLFIALFLFLIIDNLYIKKEFIESTPIIVTILVLPFLLSIGTDVDFKIRATDYIGTYFTLIFILSYAYKKKINIIFSSIILLYFINYLSMYYRDNWGQFRYSDQKFSLKEIGVNQNLFLDKVNYTNLKLLKPYFKKNEKVVVSHKNINASIYLLDVKMISYDFKLNPFKVIQRINKTLNQDTLKLVETSYYPFETDFLDDIEKKSNYNLNKIKPVGIYNIYYFIK